jgi:hypothetical protein
MQIGTKIGTNTITVNCKTVYKSMVFLLGKEMAEGKGFEPPEGVSSFNDLANRRLQPLGHPSAGVTIHIGFANVFCVFSTRRMLPFL